MEQNKTRSYLLYAVGEIALVMIGILLALQVNNWNETIKDRKQATELKQAIISDLETDVNLINQVMGRANNSIAVFDSLQSRLTDPTVTEAQVIDLIQYEFVGYITTFPGFSDNSYRSASSSGAIDKLSTYYRTILYDHYLAQVDAKTSIDVHQDQYFRDANTFIGKYPIKNSFITFNAGPVYDRIWARVDFDDLIRTFNAAGSSQRNYYRILASNLSLIRQQSLETIELLSN